MGIKDDWLADFWKTKDAIDALDKKLEPMIAARDKLQAEFEPKLRDMNQAIMEAKEPRYELAQKLAMLAKALGDKVGERP